MTREEKEALYWAIVDVVLKEYGWQSFDEAYEALMEVLEKYGYNKRT